MIGGWVFNDHGGGAYVGAVVIAMLVLRRYKIALLIFAVGFPMFTRSAWLGLAVSVIPWYLFSILRRSRIARRTALLILLACLVLTPIIIGEYFFDDKNIFILTSSRSHVYHVLWDEFSGRGISMFFPVSNIYSSEVLTKSIAAKSWLAYGSLEYQDYVGKIYKYYNINCQCAHSMYMEFLFNYGLLIGLALFASLILLENQRVWPILVYFFVVIGFQCEIFFPRFLLPFYIIYRIMYFERENSGRLLAQKHVSSKT
jgi:lysylphosphatidylglycerol synthetase-like protein (DUF2156 family)